MHIIHSADIMFYKKKYLKVDISSGHSKWSVGLPRRWRSKKLCQDQVFSNTNFMLGRGLTMQTHKRKPITQNILFCMNSIYITLSAATHTGKHKLTEDDRLAFTRSNCCSILEAFNSCKSNQVKQRWTVNLLICQTIKTLTKILMKMLNCTHWFYLELDCITELCKTDNYTALINGNRSFYSVFVTQVTCTIVIKACTITCNWP